MIYGNYDSGLVTLTDTLAAVTAIDTRVMVIMLINLTTLIQTVTVTNGAGGVYVPTMELRPSEARALNFGGILFAGGVKWNAGAAASVNAQVMGFQ